MSFLAPAIMLLAAMIVAFGLTSSAATSTLEPQVDAYESAAQRTAELNRTRLDPSGVTHGEPDFTTDPDFYVTIRNDGTAILRDLSHWDVFADHHEADGTHHALRLTYTAATVPGDDEWSSQGIYEDASALTTETYQPGILNPGEELLLRFRLSSTPGNPEANLVRIAVPNGATVLAGFTWKAATSTPDTVRNGGALTSNNGTVWAVRGRGSDSFWAYDTSADSWTTLAGVPGSVGDGSGLAYAETDGTRYVYALEGGNSRDVFRFDVDGGTWETRAGTSANVNAGGGLTWDGDAYLYALRGANRQDFWRYDLAADTWTTLADTPANVSGGGALVHVSGYVYAFEGSNQQGFWRYDVANAVWTTLGSTPDTVSNGGALTTDGTYVYALRGDGGEEFWRYDPLRDIWDALANTPAVIDWGGALTITHERIYTFNGDATTTFWSLPLPVQLPSP